MYNLLKLEILINKYKDKVQHIVYSYSLLMFLSSFMGLTLGTIVTIIVGLIKEYIHDKKLKRGTFDKKDIIANFIGMCIGIISYILIRI